MYLPIEGGTRVISRDLKVRPFDLIEVISFYHHQEYLSNHLAACEIKPYQPHSSALVL